MQFLYMINCFIYLVPSVICFSLFPFDHQIPLVTTYVNDERKDNPSRICDIKTYQEYIKLHKPAHIAKKYKVK